MKQMNWSVSPILVGLSILLAINLVMVPAARADVDLAVLPAVVTVQPGDVFDVELTITEDGSAFNGYDAVIGFDPAALTFIELTQAEQEGPLMTDACQLNFHVFDVPPPGDTINLTHIMLCAGTTVSGPGVVYRLRFQAGQLNTITYLNLLPGTAFYNAGLYVNPVFTSDSEIRIGQVSSVPGDLMTAGVNLLAAPNPFNPMTTISFEAPETRHARITVYSSRGFLVAELLDEQVSSGRNSVVWNGRNKQGRMVGSGNYMVRLELGGEPFTRWVTLVK